MKHTIDFYTQSECDVFEKSLMLLNGIFTKDETKDEYNMKVTRYNYTIDDEGYKILCDIMKRNYMNNFS